ncbi:MAG: deoxynucleoside kinase [Deltaproteobacteria bacterium]|nr:deoxynucleoside kinase [Deltaproteobacteria bacterium]
MGPAKCIAVSGNIGTGKSTLVRFLTRHFPIKPLFEPNEENPYLSDFYADMPRWAFHSQVFFLIRKFHLHQEMTQSPDPVILDRTIYEDAEIFAITLSRMGIMDKREFGTYWSLYQTLVELLKPPDLMIYLRCSLGSIKKRIAARGRPEERDVPEAYLRRLNRLYEKWFAGYKRSPTLVLRTDRIDYVSDLVDQVDVIETIERHIRGAGGKP